MTNNSISELEAALGYQFACRDLLLEALTHKSFVNESGGDGERDNQRLEFFGDAVLGFFVSEKLFQRFPDEGEGKLSKIRSSLVDEKSLARLAGDIRLGAFLRLGRGEEKTGGREKPSILADAYEALIAAVYLDGGTAAVGELVAQHFGPLLEQSAERFTGRDYKTQLQELVQEKRGMPPRYVLETEEGPPHARVFTISVSVTGECIGRGTGTSKKEAEQAAARVALKRFRMENTVKTS